MKQLILVVDDNVVRRDALRTCLQSSGFDAAVLYEPGKLMARVDVERPALIVITSGPSFGSGLTALQTLRGRDDDLPLIMLGEGGEVTERIVALECGADDFVSKPFNVQEVMVRVRVVLKRAGQFPCMTQYSSRCSALTISSWITHCVRLRSAVKWSRCGKASMRI